MDHWVAVGQKLTAEKHLADEVKKVCGVGGGGGRARERAGCFIIQYFIFYILYREWGHGVGSSSVDIVETGWLAYVEPVQRASYYRKTKQR